MKSLQLLLVLLASAMSVQYTFAQKREFYEIKIYTYTGTDQEKQIDDYLKNAYLPGVHRAGISKIGVFKPIESDTAFFGKRIYVLTPFKSLEQFAGLNDVLQKDKQYLEAGKNYIDAVYSNPPFVRMESIILQAFSHQPNFDVPKLSSSPHEQIYELRSYEGHTEKIYKNKVKMFNEGGEVTLFKRLGFNAVFYAEVLAGGRMPNLMYMTSFENQTERDAHWKTFVADPEWKKLSSMPEYQKNVSKINIYLLHPTAYSEI
jgi:hypothetical protein